MYRCRGVKENKNFPFRKCRNLLLLLARHLGYEELDFFRCRNLLLEIALKTLHIGALDKQTYLFLRKASLYSQRRDS